MSREKIVSEFTQVSPHRDFRSCAHIWAASVRFFWPGVSNSNENFPDDRDRAGKRKCGSVGLPLEATAVSSYFFYSNTVLVRFFDSIFALRIIVVLEQQFVGKHPDANDAI